MRTPNVLRAVALGGCLWACSGTSTPGEGPRPSSRDLITREEIAETGLYNAYDIIRRLRPRWLSPRVRGGMGQNTGLPAIYVGDQYWGEVDTLQRISAESIAEMRYLNARDATTRGWNRNGAGAIQIIRTIGDGP